MKKSEQLNQLQQVVDVSKVLAYGESRDFPLKRKLSQQEIDYLDQQVNRDLQGRKVLFERKGHTLRVKCREVFTGVEL